MNRLLRNRTAIVLFMLPATLIFLMFIIVPTISSIWYSLQDWNGFGEATFVGLKNYKALFVHNKDGYIEALGHALIIAIGSLCIQLPISFFFATTLARGVRGERFYLTVFFIPVILSSTVIAQLWLKIFNGQYGLLNELLAFVGMEEVAKAWLANPKTALPAVLVPILWQYIGYHMLLMYTAIRGLSSDMLEAARIDGASNFKIAVRVILPNIKPILRVCVIFAVVGSFKTYDIIHIMTKGGPVGATEVPTTLLVETLFSSYQYGYGSAMAVVIIIICFLTSALIKKFFKTEEEESV